MANRRLPLNLHALECSRDRLQLRRTLRTICEMNEMTAATQKMIAETKTLIALADHMLTQCR
jgi:hypothetical protein